MLKWRSQKLWLRAPASALWKVEVLIYLALIGLGYFITCSCSAMVFVKAALTLLLYVGFYTRSALSGLMSALACGDTAARTYATAVYAKSERPYTLSFNPEKDVDAFSATDLEDLAVFLADIAEFMHQEVAQLVGAFGETRSLLIGGSALWAGFKLSKQLLSSRKFKK